MKNVMNTVLYKIEHVTDLANPVYDGPTPVHPYGLTFCGWSEYLDDKGNAVRTAMFQSDGPDDIGVESKKPFLSNLRAAIGDVFVNVKDKLLSTFSTLGLNIEVR